MTTRTPKRNTVLLGPHASSMPSPNHEDNFLEPEASSVPAQFTTKPDNLGAHASSVPASRTNQAQDNPEVLHDPSAATSLFSSGRNPDGTFQRGNTFRFRPGQSGNPKGRPKSRSRFLSDRMRKNMMTPFPKDPDGRTYGEVMIDNMSINAVQGDFKAFLEVLDRLEGRSRQAPEKTTSDDPERWIQIGAALLAECGDNPDAKRALIAAFGKLEIEDESEDATN